MPGEVQFPPVDWADPETGLLCVGGDLSPQTLIAAYRSGIFPWPLSEGEELYWFAPEHRAVLFFDELRLPRTIRKELRRSPFEIRLNADSGEIIRSCADVRVHSGERTWITPRLMEAYERLGAMGFIRCAGAYRKGVLAGGIYGVSLGRFFAGESMFYLEPNASKLALLSLVDDLSSRGVRWMDCQQLTPLVARLGARLIPRGEFMKLLADALSDPPGGAGGHFR